MRTRMLIIGFGLALVLLVLGTFAAMQANSSLPVAPVAGQSGVQTPTEAPTEFQPTPIQSTLADMSLGIPDAEYVPLYPNAELVKMKEDFGAKHLISLTSPDPPYQIEDFYHRQLEEDGWLFSDNATQDFYTRTQSLGAIPWNLQFKFSVARSLDDKTSFITISFGRYPELENDPPIPVFPDAEQLETIRTVEPLTSSWMSNPTADPVLDPIGVITISFITSEDENNVVEFYHANLGQFGWRLFDKMDKEKSFFQALPPY